MQDYLRLRQQRVALNGQTSYWEKVLAGVPQGSVLGERLFLIYINDIPEGIKSICKIFADDILLFNPDPRKQTTEIYFQGNKIRTVIYHLHLMIIQLNPSKYINTFGLSLDKILDFNIHINNRPMTNLVIQVFN